MQAKSAGFIAYYRVSTDRQGKSGLGLEAQRAAVGRYLAGIGGILLAEHTEVETGRRNDRPELQKALAACRKHKARLVIAKLDRLSRNVAFIATMMDAGVEFVACDNPHATRLTLHILAAVAEHEREMISARTKAALQAAKARGVRLGRNAESLATANHAAALDHANQIKGVLAQLAGSGIVGSANRSGINRTGHSNGSRRALASTECHPRHAACRTLGPRCFPSSQKSYAFPTSSLARKSVSVAAFLRVFTLSRRFVRSASKIFLLFEIPARRMLLSPVLPEKSLAMLYAPRGIGKSWLGLSIGVAVASGGSLLKWEAPSPRRVLVVDGEMPLADLQARLNSILAGLGVDVPNDRLRVLAADNSEAEINLGSPEGQQALEPHLDGVDLFILDNLSTLMTTGSEGASNSWLPMQNWLLRLRRKGVAVLIVHHAGVNGRQRGTSRREDALDTVIALRKPLDYSPQEGARFEVRLEKARALVGDGAAPFEAVVEPFTAEGGKSAIRWLARDLKPSIFEQAAALFQEGRSVRQVKTLLGISHGEAGRLRLRAAAEGLLDLGQGDEREDTEIRVDGPYRLN